MLLQSRLSGTHYGSFNYLLALVEHSLGPGETDLLQRLVRGEFRDSPSDAIEHSIYTALSPLHELRHFQDQFGTFAGITLFQSRIETLKRFARAVRTLRHSQSLWGLPLGRWTTEQDCPEAIRAFRRFARAERACARAFIGDFKPLKVDTHLSALVVEVDTDLGVATDAATMRFIRESATPRHDQTILYPFGIEMVFEGSAHALTRSIVGAFASEATQVALEQRVRVPLTHDEALEDAMMPYMVLDLLVTRYMTEHGHPRFQRNLVIGLADEILSQAAMWVWDDGHGHAKAAAHRPGAMFTDMLEGADIAAFAEGHVAPSAEVDENYKRLLRGYEAQGDWTTVNDDGSPDADVAIWEAFVTQTYIRPLVELRLATRHDAFRTAEGFVTALRHLPFSISVTDGRLGISPNVPERVQLAWWRIALMDEFVAALLEERPLACPRTFGSLPGLEGLPLSRDSRCTTHIALGCGTFDGERQVETAICWFQSNLIRSHFVAPASIDGTSNVRSD